METVSKTTYRILKPLPHILLKYLKISYRKRRFNKAVCIGHINFKKYHVNYSNHILFIAGLPKSGTSWIEKMLLSFPGYTVIPDPDVTIWDYRNSGTHQFELSDVFFSRLKETLALVKVHCHGSINNVSLLKEMGIPYCIMYRDLRDAAVSYVYYVKRTPWHPEHSVYKKMTVQNGLRHFGSSLLAEWRDWVIKWQKYRDTNKSIIIKYEELLMNPIDAFSAILTRFDLPKDNIKSILELHRFNKVKKRGSFFRKGKAGDWKNHFNDEIKDIFKHEIAEFLIQEGYEQNCNW